MADPGDHLGPGDTGMLQRVVDALDAKGVNAELLTPSDYPELSPMVMGGAQGWIKLLGEEVDLLHVVGSAEEDAYLAQYMVGDVEASPIAFAQLRPKRKGLFGLGGIAGYEWKGPDLAKELNQDPFLVDLLVSSGFTDVTVWPEGRELVSIHPAITMRARQVADFLKPAHSIAKHVRRVAR